MPHTEIPNIHYMKNRPPRRRKNSLIRLRFAGCIPALSNEATLGAWASYLRHDTLRGHLTRKFLVPHVVDCRRCEQGGVQIFTTADTMQWFLVRSCESGRKKEMAANHFRIRLWEWSRAQWISKHPGPNINRGIISPKRFVTFYDTAPYSSKELCITSALAVVFKERTLFKLDVSRRLKNWN